jgi:two-component system response regulator HydG
MIKVSCAALPEHFSKRNCSDTKRGRLRANARKEGRFELANGGTLFLDEIGEVPGGPGQTAARSARRQVRTPGGTRTIDADVRIITATNKDLQKEVDDKRFRKIFLPPECDQHPRSCSSRRKDDIQLLAMHFLKLYADKNNKPIEGFSEERCWH